MKLRGSDTEAATLTNDELAKCDQSDPAVKRELDIRPQESKRRGTCAIGVPTLPNLDSYRDEHFRNWLRKSERPVTF